MRFRTVRDDIFGRYPELVELVNQRFPEDSRGAEAFKYALELYLRALPNLDAPVDGWTLLRVVEETPELLRAVGISYVLPLSELPIDAEFRVIDDSIEYRILVGMGDDQWEPVSESKRWKAVYAYATGEAEPVWSWDRPVVGRLK